jgi:DNA mismatch repair protein MutL
VTEAYRNIIPPTSFPVVLMFLEMPPEEVDVNVHPAKTEVRFRQSSFIHDFVRDTIRNALISARPAAGFLQAMTASAHATPALMPEVSPMPGSPIDESAAQSESDPPADASEGAAFSLSAPEPSPMPGQLPFSEDVLHALSSMTLPAARNCGGEVLLDEADDAIETETTPTLNSLASLKPLGQLRESFILAVNDEGLWIVDQHVAHERVLFEKILRDRDVERVQRQQLLMPMLVDLLPEQMIVFARIAMELERNGFEAEPFGPRTIAIKAAPVGLEGRQLERMLTEVLEQTDREMQSENLEAARTRIAASIACHAAIKINTRLDPKRMEWLLAELAKTEHPTSCPHGRPIALRYSWKDIQRAFQRI